MSDPTTPTDWNEVASQAVTIVGALAGFAFPGAGPAISIATKVIQGAIATEPQALALVNKITSGQPVTPAELQAYSEAYEADYQALHADIQAKLKALADASKPAA